MNPQPTGTESEVSTQSFHSQPDVGSPLAGNPLVASSPHELAAPNSGGMSPYSSSSPLDSMTYFDLVRIAWQRKPLLALGIAIALVVSAIYYARAIPIYESTAEVLVVRKRPEMVTGDQVYAARGGDDYLTTHSVLVKSPVIVTKAIEDGELGSLVSFSNDKFRDPKIDLTTAVTDQIEVGLGSKEMGRGSDNILTVSVRGPVPAECAHTVQAILGSYQNFLDETYRNMGEDTIQLIGHARDDLQKDLDKQDKDYLKFRAEAPLVTTGNDFSPHRDRLTAIETQLSELLLQEANFRAQLENIKAARKAGRTGPELVALISSLSSRMSRAYGTSRNPGTGLDTELFQLLQEEQRMRQEYGPNHPQVQSIRKRIEGTRSFFSLPNAAYQSAVDGGKLSSDPVELYEHYLEQELIGVGVSKKLLNDLYKQEHESAKELVTYELKDQGYQRKLRQTQELYDGVVSQLQGASLVTDYGGFDARVISPPALGEKVTPKAVIVFPAAVVLGGFLGCLMVIAAEVTDRRFRTTDDIKRSLGYPIIGHVPECYPIPLRELRDSKLDRMLYAFHKPSAIATEAFRGVRTALYFSTRGQSHKIIQITSSGPGDGKSTLASNLAVCIAQSGKSILLIDADLRRPRMHRVFGVPNDVGLASVIGLDVELEDTITSLDSIPNLYILPSGQVPPDPSELLSSHRFSELLESVREKFDYVVIDTGPVLAITDPSVVASRVDGVVLALRMAQNSRNHAKRAQEILNGIGANVLGVFVVGARDANASDYGYGGAYAYTASYEPSLPQSALSDDTVESVQLPSP